MKNSLLTLAVFALLLFSCQPQEGASSEATEAADVAEAPSIVGAWEVTSSTDNDGEVEAPYKSIIIYSEGYYSVEVAWEDIPSWEELEEGEERSDEDIRTSYSRLTSNSGTYEIQGDSIIHNAIVAKHPNFMNDGPRWARAFSLDGDNLATTGSRGTWALKRMR
jgi:hypothetical protein